MSLFKYSLTALASLAALSAQALTVGTLRTQYLPEPIGIDVKSPAFSWQLASDARATMQQTYQVEIATDSSMGGIVYDSGAIASSQSANVQLPGLVLAPSTRYYWRVTVTDNHGETASALSWFETGLMDSGWGAAQWICVGDGSAPAVTDPSLADVTEYTVETDFEVQRVAAGFIWGATDHSNYYMWQINTEYDKPRFRPHRWTNGNPACLEEKELPMPLANDETHHLTIEVTEGGTLANTYIDGTLIDSRRGSFPYGSLGFRSAQANIEKSNPEVAWFDDFRVTTPDGRTLFADDFETNDAFGVGYISGGSIRVDGPETLQFQRDFTPDASVTDYTFEGTFAVDQIAAGIAFAAQDEANYCMWQFNLEGATPRFRPHCWTAGNPACLAEIDLSGIKPIEHDHRYAFRIEVTEGGRRATTFVDGVEIDSRTGNFAYGKIGFRQNHGQNNARAQERAFFDNVKVTAADGNVLFAEDFSDEDNCKFAGGAVVDGRFRQGSTVDAYTWAISSTADAVTLRYDIEADITLIHDAASIIFGYKGTNNYFMWAINTNDRDYPLVRRHMYANDPNPQFSDTRIDAFTKEQLLGREHRLRLEIDGTKVRTYIDNVLVDTFTDTTGRLCNGLVGFRVYRDQVDEQAYWDNVKVTVYDADGSGRVSLSEDFERPDHEFSSGDVVSVGGDNKLYSHSTNGQSIVMQDAATAAPRFRTGFSLPAAVKSARLYTSGMGVYNVYINGERVGHRQPDGSMVYDELMPGWTDYRSTVFYMTHDVTDLLHEGENAMGALVANGWWAGDISHGIYGSPSVAFIAKLVVQLDNGETIVVDTDPASWTTSSRGPVKSGEIYHGEIYDARLVDGWTLPGYDASMWSAAAADGQTKGTLMANEGPAVRIRPTLERKPVSYNLYEGVKPNGTAYGEINIVETTPGTAPVTIRKGQTLVVDFGQNASGWARFKVKGAPGTQVNLRYAEIINDSGDSERGNDGPKGSLYTVALRSAKAMGRYTLRGDADGETYSPTTTFYGFRYCDVTATDDVTLEYITAETVGTDIEETSHIEVNDPDVNKLYSNIMWGQRSNFLSVPTDCPQRDERLGWTADTQLFSLAASYNSQVQGFYHKWMRDMRDGQLADGAFPNVAPFNWVEHGASAWADAGVILPWNVYSMYGDKAIIEENYEAMERYMDWLATKTDGSYKYAGANDVYGDWVAFEDTDRRYVSVCYYAYMADLMSRMSAVLSTAEGDFYDLRAQKYAQLFADIKAEFADRYTARRTGNLSKSSQCSHLLALKFNLLPSESSIEASRDALRRRIESNGNRLATGFIGTSIINQTLSEHGMTDLAYTLLLQHECPSWLYSVDQGATTIWERWNSYTLESGISKSIEMNSFNHYAYGAVGEWMYRYMAGIAPDDSNPGFAHMILQPNFDPENRISECSATFGSNYGPVDAEWTTRPDGKYYYRVSVPANTTATLRLPSAPEGLFLYEGDTLASEAEGITDYSDDGTTATMTLGSGSYFFAPSTAGLGSVETPLSAAPFTLAPNPATDMVSLTSPTPVARVQVRSLSGACMLSLEADSASDGASMSFSVASLPASLYLVTVTDANGATRTVKLLKR